MDHAHEPPEAVGLPVHAPHLRLCSDETPAEFVPLRLVLQPAGTVIEVDRPEMVIGRHTEADIRLPLPDVSRRHCRIQYVDGRWQVVDLNSLNGTKVNGEPVQRAFLEQGDTLRIGGFIFAIDLGGAFSKPGSGGHVQSILQTLANAPQSRAS
jgi:pSer/pThr/pTyr-binding forkhead associated (FHA) protein